MALSNYTDLQAAVRSEIDIASTAALSNATIVDAITRAEAKINRKARFREMETLAYDTYVAGTVAIADRTMSIPTGFVEMIGLQHKVASADDDTYKEVKYVAPGRIHEYYTQTNNLYYTLRQDVEFNTNVDSAHTIRFHYLKKWDIATDSTNWLLTNYPDVYLYGALVECSLHMVDDKRVPVWKALFDQGLKDLNLLSQRNRDDAELDTSEVARVAGQSTFNILTG